MQPEKERQSQRPQESILTSKITFPWDVEGIRLPRYKPEDNLHNHRIKNL